MRKDLTHHFLSLLQQNSSYIIESLVSNLMHAGIWQRLSKIATHLQTPGSLFHRLNSKDQCCAGKGKEIRDLHRLWKLAVPFKTGKGNTKKLLLQVSENSLEYPAQHMQRGLPDVGPIFP